MTDSHAGTSMLPLSTLAESPTNQRTMFTAAAMAELIASVSKHGVLQPILVRPWPASYSAPVGRLWPQYEIVCGARRFRAAKAAGLESIEASVRVDLTHRLVLEIQMVENLQRQGLHCLEEAAGFQALLDGGYTVERLTADVSKSRGYIYARLKLLELCPDARKALLAETLTASTALLIARLPSRAMQEKALREITAPQWNGDTMSVRKASAHLQSHYMLSLEGAPFPLNDLTLLNGVGSCELCPKRTGNQPADLFDDVSDADVCTDPPCYHAKQAAHLARLASQAREAGREVITGEAAAKIMDYDRPNPGSGRISLDERCYEDADCRTYRELIGEALQEQIVLIESGRRRQLIETVSETQMAQALRDAGFQSAEKKKQEKASGKRKALEDQIARENAYRGALYAAVGKKLSVALEESDAYAISHGFLAAIAQKMLGAMFPDEARKVISWFSSHESTVTRFAEAIQKMTRSDIILLIFEILTVREHDLDVNCTVLPPTHLLRLADDFGIDAAAIRTTIEARENPPTATQAARARGREDEKKTPPTATQAALAHGRDGEKKTPAAAAPGEKPAPPVKYVHPVLGETWSGRGRRPIWVNEWLEAGNTLESLLPAAAEKSIEVENSDRASAAEDQHDAKAIETNETPIEDVRP